MNKLLLKVAGGLVGFFVLLQLVPYGRDHTNPPGNVEPAWDSPATRELAVKACFDCHSNQTKWPWYSNIAPVSWLVQYDVEEGRETLNFSEFDKPQKEAEEAGEAVQEGEMPDPKYLITHPEARLSAAQKDQLVKGLVATLGGELEGGGAGGGHDEDGDDD